MQAQLKAPAPPRKTENPHGPGQFSYLYSISLQFLRSPIHCYFTNIFILLKSLRFFIHRSRLQERKPLCAHQTANKQLQRMQCVVETDFRLPVTWHSLARRWGRTFGYEFSISSPFAKNCSGSRNLLLFYFQFFISLFHINVQNRLHTSEI